MNPSEHFKPGAPLPSSDTVTVDASKTAAALEALLDGIETCAKGVVNFGPEGAQQFGEAAEHLARALDLVADFGHR